MSESVIAAKIGAEIRAKNLAVLQEVFERRGGTGNVSDFLEWGATDPEDGKENHWGTMTPEQQQLWLDLDNTGLTELFLVKAKQTSFGVEISIH